MRKLRKLTRFLGKSLKVLTEKIILRHFLRLHKVNKIKGFEVVIIKSLKVLIKKYISYRKYFYLGILLNNLYVYISISSENFKTLRLCAESLILQGFQGLKGIKTDLRL